MSSFMNQKATIWSPMSLPNITSTLGPLASMSSSSSSNAGALAGLALLPNPFTPFAFLPPDIARQYIVAMFVLVASFTILLWDVLNNLRSDYILLTRHKLRLPTAVYIFSRILNLAYLLGELIVTTAPIGNCRNSVLAATTLLTLAIPSTSLLLFFQVRAVYIRNPFIVSFFGLLWIGVIGACATQVIAASTGMAIGPTKYCVQYSQAKPFSAAPAIVVLANDTMMFMAVVYKILQCSMDSSSDLKTGFKTFIFGTSLPSLSRALLQNGQAYFFGTVGINLITVIFFYNTAIPPIYRIIIGFPDIALMNVMASRIYRNTKLGVFNLPAQPSGSNNQHSNRPHTGGVVIGVTRKLEKTPPSMETLNGARVDVFQLKESSTFNDSTLSPTTIDSTVEQDYGHADYVV